MIALAGTTRSLNLPLKQPVPGSNAGGSDAFLQVVGERQVLHLDTPAADSHVTAAAFTVSGYAADLAAVSGSGVDSVHVYAYPLSGSAQPPVFLGLATYGAPRSSLTPVYGPQFTNSGFTLGPVSLPPGRYLLAVFAHSTVSGTFAPPLTREFSAVGGLSVEIDEPADGPVGQVFSVRGYAVDLNAATGTGVNTVHVWAYPNPGSGAPAVFLGAGYGESRPDIAAAFGTRFEHSGFSVAATLAPGRYQIVSYAQSSTTGGFDAFDVAQITVATSAPLIYFDSPAGPDVFSGFVVSGWAADINAPSGTGIDAVHVWAYPNPGSGEAAMFLGSMIDPRERNDVAALLGPRFRMTGFEVPTTPLTPGNYLIAVFGRSTVTGQFNALATRTLHVRAAEPVVRITSPPPGANPGSFMLEGFAFDPSGGVGTGIDGIHVWVYRNLGSGTPAEFVGLATYGDASEAATAQYGAGWVNSGFHQPMTLPAGTHLIAVYAHSPAAPRLYRSTRGS